MARSKGSKSKTRATQKRDKVMMPSSVARLNLGSRFSIAISSIPGDSRLPVKNNRLLKNLLIFRELQHAYRKGFKLEGVTKQLSPFYHIKKMVCKARKERKEILFAKNKAGKGGKRGRYRITIKSKFRC